MGGERMADEKFIQFVANYEDWVSVKKLKVEPGMEPRTVMEFLASLGTGIDKKVEENLRKCVALDKLDAALKEEIKPGKTEADLAGVLAAVNGRKVSAVINEITELPKLQKNERGELFDFCKVYALRKAFKECKLMIDYSSIEIPGMKRVMKSKV